MDLGLEQRLQRGGLGVDLHESSRRRTQPGMCSLGSRLLGDHGGGYSGSSCPRSCSLSLNINIIWLRSYCKEPIQAIITNQRLVELFGVLSITESLVVFSFFTFHVSFISRSSNGSPDSLAKASLCNRLLVLGLYFLFNEFISSTVKIFGPYK